MSERNIKIAIESMERALEKAKKETYLKRVELEIACSHGGISNVSLKWDESGLCSQSCSSRDVDDPGKAVVLFHYLLQKIKDTRHNGLMKFIIWCQDGRVYNLSIAEQHNDLFSRTTL